MIWRRPIFGAVIAILSACGFAQAACSARTPQQALPPGSIAATSLSSTPPVASFYRLAQIVVDPELHRRWALIADCTHPERPMEILALNGPGIVAAQSAQVVSSPQPLPAVARRPIQRGASRDRLRPFPPAVAAFSVSTAATTSAPASFTTASLIHAGDLVRLWSTDGNVQLEMAVVSLEYGHLGQIIHVRRPGQTVVLAGVVVGKDSAELIP